MAESTANSGSAAANTGSLRLVSGAELKFARKALGLRQTELAEYLGVEPETISRWENNRDPFKRRDQLAVLALLEHVAGGGELEPPQCATEETTLILNVATDWPVVAHKRRAS
jgi:transcriptional regulator with XRE-family HTH domain